MKRYAIAYLNTKGTGQNVIEPFVLECDSEEQAHAEVDRMKRNGFQQVVVFSYDELERPTNMLWSFIRKHALTD